MTILAQAKEAAYQRSPRSAEKMDAFLNGYFGWPLDAGMAADPELQQDWEHGKHRAQAEVANDNQH